MYESLAEQVVAVFGPQCQALHSDADLIERLGRCIEDCCLPDYKLAAQTQNTALIKGLGNKYLTAYYAVRDGQLALLKWISTRADFRQPLSNKFYLSCKEFRLYCKEDRDMSYAVLMAHVAAHRGYRDIICWLIKLIDTQQQSHLQQLLCRACTGPALSAVKQVYVLCAVHITSIDHKRVVFSMLRGNNMDFIEWYVAVNQMSQDERCALLTAVYCAHSNELPFTALEYLRREGVICAGDNFALAKSQCLSHMHWIVTHCEIHQLDKCEFKHDTREINSHPMHAIIDWFYAKRSSDHTFVRTVDNLMQLCQTEDNVEYAAALLTHQHTSGLSRVSAFLISSLEQRADKLAEYLIRTNLGNVPRENAQTLFHQAVLCNNLSAAKQLDQQYGPFNNTFKITEIFSIWYMKQCHTLIWLCAKFDAVHSVTREVVMRLCEYSNTNCVPHMRDWMLECTACSSCKYGHPSLYSGIECPCPLIQSWYNGERGPITSEKKEPDVKSETPVNDQAQNNTYNDPFGAYPVMLDLFATDNVQTQHAVRYDTRAGTENEPCDEPDTPKIVQRKPPAVKENEPCNAHDEDDTQQIVRRKPTAVKENELCDAHDEDDDPPEFVEASHDSNSGAICAFALLFGWLLISHRIILR